MQTLLVILIVLAAATFLARYAYRFLHPPRVRACGGNCCDTAKPESPAPSAAPQTVFFSSDDLARRLKARKS